MFQTYFLLIVLLLISPTTERGKLEGAWRLQGNNTEETVKIYADGYFMFATYDKVNKKFISAGGGTYALDGKKYKETLEYNTTDSTKVGTSWATKISDLTESKLTFKDRKAEIWQKIYQSTTSLTGNWRITARADANGKVNPMQKSARKTLKILSGTRFQWAAINTDTKQFFGTGGGTYTAKDGKYIETLEFFSRDNNRVGANLPFEYEVKGSDWFHSGLSSKGDKINEVWSREK